MPKMLRVVLIMTLALVPACAGQGSPPAQDPTAEIGALTERVATLESELEEEAEAATRLEDDAQDQARRLSQRLERSLDRLRASLGEVRGSVAGGVDEAATALGQAQAVASQLQVLEQRYEYHLRRYHGGG